MIMDVMLLLINSNTYNMFQIVSNRQLNNDIFHTESEPHYSPETNNAPINAQQQTTSRQMDRKIRNEHFYFSIDIKKNAITHCKGVNNCLGYIDSHFSIKDYLQVIHPAHAIADGFYAAALSHCITNKTIALSTISRITHVSLVALQHKNGKYIYCKKESRALQITDDYKILEYSNEFTIIKEFNNDPYIFRIYDNNGKAADVEKTIRQSVKTNFEITAGFSVQELRILKRYAAQENISSEMIAGSFKVEKSTISTYNKRILNKAENIFDHRFKNAKNVAGYLKEIGLI